MSDELPSVTVVIAARPGQAEVKAVSASRHLRFPAGKLDVIIARGRQPSAQRNAAMKAARGDWIYFLDDDSIPEPDNLQSVLAHLLKPEVKMVGGPNLCPPEAPALEQVFALVLASAIAFGPSRARYAVVGDTRETSEKELILCNLLARRESLVHLGGFDESLYPNEENALMDELQRKGGKLIYEPRLVVYRRPRPSLRAFARMLMTYGRGRAEQFRLHPTPGSALNFVPPLFCVYLLGLAASFLLWPRLGLYLALPLALYAVALLGQAMVLMRIKSSSLPNGQPGEPHNGLEATPARKSLRAFAAIPLMVLTHILYGFGFWGGLFTSLRPSGERPPGEVNLERF